MYKRQLQGEVAYAGQELLLIEVVIHDGQAETVHDGQDLVEVLAGEQAAGVRDVGGHGDPHADRGAVGNTEAGDVFERVGDRVAEVEGALQIAFERVGTQQFQLPGDAPVHDREQGGGGRLLAEAGQEVEEGGVVDDGDIEGFPVCGHQLRAGERGEGVEVDVDLGGVGEGADEVLLPGMVGTGLPSDRSVDHRQQRGGDVGGTDPPEVESRNQAGQVAEHSPTDRCHGRLPVDAGFVQHRDDPRRPVQGFTGLPRFHHQTAARSEYRPQILLPCLVHASVEEHEVSAACEMRDGLGEPRLGNGTQASLVEPPLAGRAPQPRRWPPRRRRVTSARAESTS